MKRKPSFSPLFPFFLFWISCAPAPILRLNPLAGETKILDLDKQISRENAHIAGISFGRLAWDYRFSQVR